MTDQGWRSPLADYDAESWDQVGLPSQRRHTPDLEEAVAQYNREAEQLESALRAYITLIGWTVERIIPAPGPDSIIRYDWWAERAARLLPSLSVMGKITIGGRAAAFNHTLARELLAGTPSDWVHFILDRTARYVAEFILHPPEEPKRVD